MIFTLTDDDAKKIAELYRELSDFLNGKQVSKYYDMKFMDCAYKVHTLSDECCIMNRYLSDSNFESGRYRITLTYKYDDDRILVEKYLDEINQNT